MLFVFQLNYIKSVLKNDDVKVSSVDGFQGSEKEVIIISMVRSNESGYVSYLLRAVFNRYFIMVLFYYFVIDILFNYLLHILYRIL